MKFPWTREQQRQEPFLAIPVKRAQTRPLAYYCTSDNCDNALTGLTLAEVAVGCLRMVPPKPFAELTKELKDRITSGAHCMCPDHPQNPLAFICPATDCFKPLMPTVPIGLWAPPFSGKTIACVAFDQEFSKQLRARTRVGSVAVYSGDAFPSIGEDGFLPNKTGQGDHYAARFILTRSDWHLPWSIGLTDMSGEYYDDLFGDAHEDEWRLRQSLMLRTREAMFMIDPETSGPLSAGVKRSLGEPLRRIFSSYRAAKMLSGLDESTLRDLLLGQTTILHAHHYPPGGAVNGGYRNLAARLVESAVASIGSVTGKTFGEAETTVQVQTIGDHLAEIVKVVRPSPHKQLSDLVGFLGQWGCPKTNGRFDIRLALTVSKADLLGLDLPDDRSILANVSASSPWSAWRERLQALSDASRSVLERYEPNLVGTAMDSFRSVGFFFMSSLGRPVEYDIDARGEIRQRASMAASGVRSPTPRGVLWPPLWLMADGAQ